MSTASHFIQRGRAVKRPPITTTLGALCLESLSKRNPDDKVLIAQIDGAGVERCSLSAREVIHFGKIVAIVLREHGLQSGDSFMLACGNTLDVAPIFLGAFISGIAVFPVHPEAGARDFQHLLSTVMPSLVFCDDASLRDISEAVSVLAARQQQQQHQVGVITLASLSKRLTLEASVDAFRLVDIADISTHVAAIMPSSGTTGRPKGVEMTQHSLMYMLLSSRHNMAGVKVGINITGPSWASGMYFNCLALSTEGTLVLVPKFGERAFLEAIQKHKVNIAFIGPSAMTALAKWKDTDKYDSSSLLYMMVGGSKISETLIGLVEEKMRVPVAIIYGMTESYISFDPAFGVVGKRGTSGRIATNASAKIVDVDTGEPLGANCEGEICLKTKVMLKKYRGNPEATKALFDEQGFLRTGDIGFYDQDGYFYVVDRLKELIKYKLTHMSATDIEEILYRLADVKEAAVVGIHHEVDVEHATAFIIRQPGSPITAQDILSLVEESLPQLKWLHGGVVFVDDFPRTPSGKIRKRDLRSAFEAGKSTPAEKRV